VLNCPTLYCTSSFLSYFQLIRGPMDLRRSQIPQYIGRPAYKRVPTRGRVKMTPNRSFAPRKRGEIPSLERSLAFNPGPTGSGLVFEKVTYRDLAR
jgi:hypothetical protein